MKNSHLTRQANLDLCFFVTKQIQRHNKETMFEVIYEDSPVTHEYIF